MTNRGLLRSREGDLTLRSTLPTVPFDLDGVDEGALTSAAIHALEGSLSIEALVLGTFDGEIRVDPDGLLVFGGTWDLGIGGLLRLEGNQAPARILASETTLGGRTEVSGYGRLDSRTTFRPFSRLALGIGGSEPGTEHGQLQVDDRVDLDGSLEIQRIDDFVPAAGEEFVLVVANEVVGRFDQITGTRFGSRQLQIVYEPTRVVAIAFSDCNGNGLPDADDIASGLSQDINGNGYPDECEIGTVPWDFEGTAAGGTVELEVDGYSATCVLSVVTTAGDTTEMVVAGLAAAINGDPCFAGQMITAEADGSRLVIRGFAINALDVRETIDDPGLGHGHPVPEVPALSQLGLALLAALLLLLGLRHGLPRSG
ncbi:MAG: IPTL-CTERM sorting domain-containing protein [Holophagales bacterium]|nr:IPTL-CTERM sorting domain-containing protein [Holophagales bacterium]